MLKIVLAIAISLGYPAGWQINVVNEKLWAEAQRKYDASGTDTGFTLLKAHQTILRKKAVEHMSRSELRIVLAHELGHILGHTSDEREAERLAREYLKRSERPREK